MVAPARMMPAELVADRIVLPDEERMHHTEPEPPVAVESGLLDPPAPERETAVVQPQLALAEGAERVRRLLIAPVDLRTIPPGADLVDGRRRCPLVLEAARRIGGGLWHEHRGLPEPPGGVMRRKRDLVHTERRVHSMAHPAVDHELNPRCREHVEEWDL